jgi:SAM-dependent methyltransferase
LVRGDIESLPFPAETFDAVVTTGVLEYAEPSRALGELSRVLRAGGLAVVSYPNPRALYGVWKSTVWYAGIRGAKRVLRRNAEYPRGGRMVPPERFAELLAGAGLSVTDVRYASYLVLPTPLDMLAPRLTVGLGERLEARRTTPARFLAAQIVYRARKAAE